MRIRPRDVWDCRKTERHLPATQSDAGGKPADDDAGDVLPGFDTGEDALVRRGNRLAGAFLLVGPDGQGIFLALHKDAERHLAALDAFDPECQDVRNGQGKRTETLGIPDAHRRVAAAGHVEEDRIGHGNLRLRRICDVTGRNRQPIVVRLNGDVPRGRTGGDGSNHLVQESLPWRQGKVTRQLHHVVDTAVVDSCRTRCQSARSDLPCNALLAVVKSDGRRVQELRIDCVGLFADTPVSDVEVVQQNLSPMGSVRRQHRCGRRGCTHHNRDRHRARDPVQPGRYRRGELRPSTVGLRIGRSDCDDRAAAGDRQACSVR